MNVKENFYSLFKTGFLIFITLFIAIIGLPCLFLPRKYTAMLIHNWSKIMLIYLKSRSIFQEQKTMLLWNVH